MPDVADVELAIGQLINSVLYPNGDTSPSAIVVNGETYRCKIVLGWPVPGSVEEHIVDQVITVSISAPPGMERNDTRYGRRWLKTADPVHTLTMTVDGNQITVGGTFSTAVAQNTVVLVNDVLFQYSCQSGDTPISIANALAALINEQFEASASDGVITVPVAHSLVARVGGYGTAIQEVKRQIRQFQIVIWAPPAKVSYSVSLVRDTVAKMIDPVLAQTNFLSFTDGSTGRLRYVNTHEDDSVQKINIYRRDLFYTVEYGTTITSQVAEAIGVTTTTQGSAVSFSDMTPSEPPPQITNA